MVDEFEQFAGNFSPDELNHEIKRKEYQCPYCKYAITEQYIDQNPFTEIPCPSCSAIIKATSLQAIVVPSRNQRTDKRCDVSLKVTYQSFDKFITDYTKNVSSGGMFVKTKTPHEKGSKTDLFLHVPGMDEPLKIIAEVVHVNLKEPLGDDSGIGVKFIDLDESSRQKLVEFIKSREDC